MKKCKTYEEYRAREACPCDDVDWGDCICITKNYTPSVMNGKRKRKMKVDLSVIPLRDRKEVALAVIKYMENS